jgi:hypothetical protein
MAECNPWDKASQQHMALRQQADSVHPVVLDHQPQTALAEIQALERQRLALVQQLPQSLQPESLQDLQKPIQTPYSTEGN